MYQVSRSGVKRTPKPQLFRDYLRFRCAPKLALTTCKQITRRLSRFRCPLDTGKIWRTLLIAHCKSNYRQDRRLRALIIFVRGRESRRRRHLKRETSSPPAFALVPRPLHSRFLRARLWDALLEKQRMYHTGQCRFWCTAILSYRGNCSDALPPPSKTGAASTPNKQARRGRGGGDRGGGRRPAQGRGAVGVGDAARSTRRDIGVPHREGERRRGGGGARGGRRGVGGRILGIYRRSWRLLRQGRYGFVIVCTRCQMGNGRILFVRSTVNGSY